MTGLMSRLLAASLVLCAACDNPVEALGAPLGASGAGEGEGEGETSEGEGEPAEGEGEPAEGEGEGEGEGEPGCPDGFLASGDRCLPEGPAALVDRTEAEVCARFAADHQDVFPEWEATPGSVDPCDPGTIPPAALDNALRRTNLYRWLVGLPPVVLEESLRDQQQACAVVQDQLGFQLDHHPGPEAACYSAAAAAGAGSSNLAAGAGLAGSIDLYVGDRGVDSLGHRRWVLNPGMGFTQFGVKNSHSCMYSFAGGGSADPDWVAWPPPGAVPVAAAAGAFSFHSARFAPTSDTVVEVAVDEGDYVEVPRAILPPGYGPFGAVRFAPSEAAGAVWQAGRTIRVKLSGTRGGEVRYTIRFVDCS